jgi:uncharacterized protein (DUF433 family)
MRNGTSGERIEFSFYRATELLKAAGVILKDNKGSMNPLLTRISVNPAVCFGKPCIRGTRIWVSLILDFLAAGSAVEEILADYPHLQRDDVLAAIAYGAEMSRERFVDLPGTPAA